MLTLDTLKKVILIFVLSLNSCDNFLAISNKSNDHILKESPNPISSGLYHATKKINDSTIHIFLKIHNNNKYEMRFCNDKGFPKVDYWGNIFQYTKEGDESLEYFNIKSFEYDSLKLGCRYKIPTITRSAKVDTINQINTIRNISDTSFVSISPDDTLKYIKIRNDLTFGWPSDPKINEIYYIIPTGNISCMLYSYISIESGDTIVQKEAPIFIDTASYNPRVCLASDNSADNSPEYIYVPIIGVPIETKPGMPIETNPALPIVFPICTTYMETKLGVFNYKKMPNEIILDTLRRECFVNNDTIYTEDPYIYEKYVNEHNSMIKNKSELLNSLSIINVKDSSFEDVPLEVDSYGDFNRIHYIEISNQPSFITYKPNCTSVFENGARNFPLPKFSINKAEMRLGEFLWSFKLFRGSNLLDSIFILSRVE